MQLQQQLESSAIRSLHGMDVPWLLSQWAQRQADKPALIWEPFSGQGRRWTYAELAHAARRVAVGLHRAGVRPGDFVIIHLDNAPEFVFSWYGCALLGAVAVSTNTRSVARDLNYFAGHTAAVAAITQPAYAELLHDSCPDLRQLWVTDNDAGEPATTTLPAGCLPFSDLLGTDLDDSELPARPTEPMAALSVQFTSGTTSRPKAVLWTHANGLWAGRICAAHMRLRRDDVTLVFLPLFHTNAQAWSMLATHWSGGTMVLQPRFSASRFWEVSLRHAVTWTSVIPFVFKAIADQQVPRHHYRFWGTGAYLPKLGQRFGVDFIGWWGMTETLTQGIVTDLDHPGPHGTMGRVAPEYAIEIRRPDGSLVQPGEKGLLFIRGIRGVSLFKEYYGNPEANAKAFDANGWFDTGDIVRMDADGWLFFSDREKDMLKVGAENVAASEIESVIMETGLVQECAVVGRQHPMLDEVPVAFVIPLSGIPAAEIQARVIAHCQAQLADFKVVREVHVVDSLPRSTLEKIAKQELRKQLTPIEA